ncbi:uncharacterized protein [Paralichthys olivaceus]|uniref:uncharacterized protein isoform X2 n=1 Tax=Paralichthys olivaceus TaxID=8255 RepID=UPI00375045B7
MVFLIVATQSVRRLLVAKGFHCCAPPLSLFSLSLCFFTSFFIFSCLLSLSLSLSHPSLHPASPHLSLSISLLLLRLSSHPHPSLPPYPSLSSLSLSRRCHITPHALLFAPFLPLSLFLSPSSISSLLSHSLSRLVTGCQSICRGRATTGFFQCSERRRKGESSRRSEKRESGGGQAEGEEEKKRRRRSFVKHSSLPSSLSGSSSISTTASSTTAAAPAAGSSISCQDLPPLSPQGALPGTGRGREITTSQFAADSRQGIRRREGRKGGWKEGEGILEEVHRESRVKATPWVTEEQSGEEEKRRLESEE